LSPPSSLDGLIERLPSDPHLRGEAFERTVRWFLKTDPSYASELREVWLWRDWPGRWGADIGIDLVAETWEGKLWAIQVKGYEPGNQVPTSEIDSFISASSRPEFDHRLLISTGQLSRNAEYKLTHQDKSTAFLLYHHLTESPLDWLAYLDESRPALVDKKSPRPHQQKAIDDVIGGFSDNDRGRLIMACGTGKTLVGVWVAERLKSVRTLVLVPSLSLVNQVSREWYVNSREPFRALFVCSDQTVADDAFVTNTGGLGHSVTTDPERVRDFLSGPGRRVMFSTYQSSPQIAAAQDSGAPGFDLVIADEAHHCAGKVDSAFATVLDPDNLKANHRLFMTATPRYLSRRLRDEVGQLNVQANSMDDPSVFGPEFHVLTFGQAIEQELLSDYQVLIIGVTDREVKRLIDNRTTVELSGAIPPTDAESLAAMLGVSKAVHRYDLHHVITFHNRVKRAQEFSSSFSQVNARLPDDESVPNLWPGHISGNMPTGERARILQRFRDATEGVSLLSNARCLGEGVDIPAIDGIGFIDPRRSNIDIVQAVGRAIRKSDQKKVGSIIIPVFIDDVTGENTDELLHQSRFSPIWSVLSALRAHDEVLREQIDQLRFEWGRHGRMIGTLPAKVSIDMPTEVGMDFVQAINIRIVETTTASWEFWIGLLTAYTEREGHSRVHVFHKERGYPLGRWVIRQRNQREWLSPEQVSILDGFAEWAWSVSEAAWEEGFAILKKFLEREGHLRVSGKHVEDGFGLGKWVNRQRSRTGLRSPEQITRLGNLPGWVWSVPEAAWEEGFDALQKYIEREGHARVPESYMEEDYRLGNWVSAQRTGRNKGRLSQERISRLDSLTEWTWDPHDVAWENGFDAVEKYAEREGHARVPRSHQEDDFALGVWVGTQRQRRERLSPKQISRLERLQGWVWNTLGINWEERFAVLKRYVEREGHARVPDRLIVDGFNLGSWVSTQRTRRQEMSEERKSLLVNLPGWVWNTRRNAWEEGFSALRKYIAREGHSRISQSHIEDGFSLGRWVTRQRSRKESLPPERISRLESLAGWVWDALADAWEVRFAALLRYVEREGHAAVPLLHIEDGHKLGHWASNCRFRAERLTADQKSRLGSLPGWEWPS